MLREEVLPHLRGTIYDPLLRGVLDVRSAAILNDSPVAPGGRLGVEKSVMVSIAPHDLTYLDIRIATVARHLAGEGVKVILLLRDQKPDGQMSFSAGQARLLDLLRLLGMPRDSLSVLTWRTNVDRLLSADDNLHRYLGALDMGRFGDLTADTPQEYRNFGDVLASVLDVYLASRPSAASARWLISGPSRTPVHIYAKAVYESVFDEPGVDLLPLPKLPFLASLPSLAHFVSNSVPDFFTPVSKLRQADLRLLHLAFFEPLEDALGESLRVTRADAGIMALKKPALVSATVEAFKRSRIALHTSAQSAGTADVHEVIPSETEDVVRALGQRKGKPLEILNILIASDRPLTASSIRSRLAQPEDISNLRRHLDGLRVAGLVTRTGVKPHYYRPVARNIVLRVGTRRSGKA